MVERIQGFSLDMLIISALGTLSLQVIAANWAPFLLLVVVGLAWSLGAFVFLARRMIPDYWFERGIGDMGQSMGVTATGLILLRIADPDLRTPAYPAFGYKQLVLEPFFGGGLVTAVSIPLIVQYGPTGCSRAWPWSSRSRWQWACCTSAAAGRRTRPRAAVRRSDAAEAPDA